MTCRTNSHKIALKGGGKNLIYIVLVFSQIGIDELSVYLFQLIYLYGGRIVYESQKKNYLGI